MTMQAISEGAEYTLQFINQTHRNVFLTGKAGTGKTTLLREIIQTTHKHTVVVAPTGIAALNAGGVTIHSMFQLPFGGFIPDNSANNFADNLKFETPLTLRRHFKMSAQKRAVIQNMELLIVDEVSMLRADLLDAIDFMMQSVRKNKNPFGGVQVLFIGDLMQLPPIIRDDEWRVLRNYYKGKFFFHAQVLQKYPPLYIELSKIFRQSDDRFISVLNNLRNNKITPQDVATLNQYVNRDFDLKANKGYITLTTHNAKADSINNQALEDLAGKTKKYLPEIIGDFPEKIFPVEEVLQLKVGAQIMFVKNDLSFEKRYFNGKMGVIKSLSEKEIMVNFPEENMTIEVDKYEWNNIKYSVNPSTKEIDEEVLGTFVHYPIKLAWAITVHKSQGLTFDKAALDVSQVFLPGQAYVALSRLRSLEGLVLLTPIQMNGISSDQDVMDYALNKASEETLKSNLLEDTKKFIHTYLKNSFDWNDLAQEWRNHQFSYKEDAEKSGKTKYAHWAQEQAGVVWKLLEPSSKFLNQLDKLFYDTNFDIKFVEERILAAFKYFFEPMDKLVYELLWKLFEIQTQKKVKGFYEELILLEDLQTKAVMRLMKAKLLIETFASGATISKETLNSAAIKNYKINKTLKIQEEFKALNITLIEDEVALKRYSKEIKAPKTAKKSTFLETLALFEEQKTIVEIANIRKLTVSTIYSHLTKLIRDESLSIKTFFTEHQIAELTVAFDDYTEDTLTILKEKMGEKYTWDELRLFKASLK